MTRLITIGGETNAVEEWGGGATNTNSTLSSGTPSPTIAGSYSLRHVLNVPSGTLYLGSGPAQNITASTTITYYISFILRMTKLPTRASGACGLIRTSATTYLCILPSGKLQIASNSTTLVGSASSATLSLNTDYVITFSSLTNGTNITHSYRVDGVLQDTQTFANANTINSFRLGLSAIISSSGTETAEAWFDNLKVNDSSGSAENSWPNTNPIVFLAPAADSSVGSGWQKPGGATTNLYTSVDNIPPVGVADTTSSANAENQIRNASANTAYAASLTAPSSAGVSGTVTGFQALAAVAAPTSTGAKTGSIEVTSNPTIAALSFSNYYAGAAASTFPTGWQYVYSTAAVNPTVTLSTQPVLQMNITGGTTTRIAMICSMGAYIEYAPSSPTNNSKKFMMLF